MQVFHHILFSRVLSLMAFCMFLVLTPRAWVEAGDRGATEEVPVNTLEVPSDCLWCEPAPASQCDDTEQRAPQNAPHWLNPDRSAAPVEAPCDPRPSPHA